VLWVQLQPTSLILSVLQCVALCFSVLMSAAVCCGARRPVSQPKHPYMSQTRLKVHLNVAGENTLQTWCNASQGLREPEPELERGTGREGGRKREREGERKNKRDGKRERERCPSKREGGKGRNTGETETDKYPTKGRVGDAMRGRVLYIYI